MLGSDWSAHLRLDISVTDSMRVNVCQRSEELIHVELDEGDGDGLLLLAVLPGHLVHCLGDVFQHQVQIYLILICHKVSCETESYGQALPSSLRWCRRSRGD